VLVVDSNLDEVEVVVLRVVVVTGGVVQLAPMQRVTLMSPQFQNFSAPLPLVLGSTTSAGQLVFEEPHHSLDSPPNFDAIQDFVESLSKYSLNPAGEQELADTQNH
jgi:hypothetical protein